MKKIKEQFKYIPSVGERVEFAAKFVPNANNLLDVGCGDGIIKYFIKNKVKNIFGIDNSNLIIQEAKNNGLMTKVVDLDTQVIPYRNDFFDVVTCLDVIEHVRNPNYLLNNINRVLARQGMLIISTPNIRFSDHVFKLLFKGFFPKTSLDESLYDGGHIHFFTFKDLRDLLKHNNFEIVQEEGIINKMKRGWKGRIVEFFLRKRLMNEFRSPGMLFIAKKI